MRLPFSWWHPPVSVLTAAMLSLPTAPGGAVPAVIIHRPIASLSANHSTNWSGYNQGTIERGGTLFHAVSGTWLVPTATAHQPGENEYSSTWVGIGGGCLDAGCTVTDSTLIQAGTEQDVDASGHAAYSAWWEIIPAPAMPIDLVVTAGDRMIVTIAETVPGVWGITIINQTTGQGWSTTTPYLSTYATAEWIVESPVVVGGGGSAGIASLPGLSTVGFDHATVNGGGPDLIASEAMELINASGQVLATPSGPDAELDGFNDCTYAVSCEAPSAAPQVRTIGLANAGASASSNSGTRHHPSGKRRTSESGLDQRRPWTMVTGPSAGPASMVTPDGAGSPPNPVLTVQIAI